VFLVIGGVYVVDALVFAGAALLQMRRRRCSATATTTTAAGDFVGGDRKKFPTSRDVHMTSVDATPTVSVPPMFSTYGAVVARGGTTTCGPASTDEAADNGGRREQTETPSIVRRD